MSEHTPGPWKVSGEVESVVVSDVPINTNGVHTGHNHKKYYGGYCIAESIANKENANLIAAAPEMLEALEETRKFLNDEVHVISFESMVDNAIKKAKGEEK